MIIEIEQLKIKIRQLEEEKEALEDVLREIACSLGVGGYNSDTVVPEVYSKKIFEGIEYHQKMQEEILTKRFKKEEE